MNDQFVACQPGPSHNEFWLAASMMDNSRLDTDQFQPPRCAMPKDKLTGNWAGAGWTPHSYAWRGSHVKAPMGGPNIRAVVAQDTKGKFHPGLRNSDPRGSREDSRMVYEDHTSYASLDRAVEVAKTMLTERLDAQQQTQSHIDASDREQSARAFLENFGTVKKDDKAQAQKPVLDRSIKEPSR